MDTVPLFSQVELAQAFCLIMTTAAATRWAKEWFSRFADDDNVDEQGRYLFEAWAFALPDGQAAGVAQASSGNSSGGTVFEKLRAYSDDELGEYLMYFSDFHLNLLSLSSPVVAERIRTALGDSPETAARKREQMQRIVTQIRGKSL